MNDYKNLSIIKSQNDKSLELSKSHITYLNNVRSDVQGRFSEFLDRNSFEQVKNENILLKVELIQHKLFKISLDPIGSTEINMGLQYWS